MYVIQRAQQVDLVRHIEVIGDGEQDRNIFS